MIIKIGDEIREWLINHKINDIKHYLPILKKSVTGRSNS